MWPSPGLTLQPHLEQLSLLHSSPATLTFFLFLKYASLVQELSLCIHCSLFPPDLDTLTYPHDQYLLQFHILQEACSPSNVASLLLVPQSLSVTLLGFIFYQGLITRLPCFFIYVLFHCLSSSPKPQAPPKQGPYLSYSIGIYPQVLACWH